MTFRDFILICVVAPLVVVALLGSMWLTLEYYDVFFGGEDTAYENGGCEEEEGRGLCGVKRFFKHGDFSTTGEIDL